MRTGRLERRRERGLERCGAAEAGLPGIVQAARKMLTSADIKRGLLQWGPAASAMQRRAVQLACSQLQPNYASGPRPLP